MARVKYTGNQKAFEGVVAGISDAESIQKAVKGTRSSADQLLVTKNMLTIAAYSHWDMFDPKRTSSPIDMGQYRGFPILTVSLTNFAGIVQGTSPNYSGNITFSLNSNTRYVGYPYELFIEVWSGDAFTPLEPDNPDSPSDNYKSQTITVLAGSVLNANISMNFTEVIVNQQNNAVFTVRVGYKDNPYGTGLVANQFFYNNGTTELKNTFGDGTYIVVPQANAVYEYSHSITPITERVCLTYQLNGSPIAIFSNSNNLSIVGSIVSMENNAMVYVSGEYVYQNANGNYLILIRTNFIDEISYVDEVLHCGENPPQQ